MTAIDKTKLFERDIIQYLKGQEECGLCVGDTVKVKRAAETYEKGWNNSWVPDMDTLVGKTITISEIRPWGFYFVDDRRYSYPYFILELVEKAKEREAND